MESQNGKILWKTNVIKQFIDNSYKLKGFYKLQNRNQGVSRTFHILAYHSKRDGKLLLIRVRAFTGELEVIAEYQIKGLKHIYKHRIEQQDFLYIIDK